MLTSLNLNGTKSLFSDSFNSLSVLLPYGTKLSKSAVILLTSLVGRSTPCCPIALTCSVLSISDNVALSPPIPKTSKNWVVVSLYLALSLSDLNGPANLLSIKFFLIASLATGISICRLKCNKGTVFNSGDIGL